MTIKFVKKQTNWNKTSIHNLKNGTIYSIINDSDVLKCSKKESGFYFIQEIKILYKRNFKVF